MSQEEEVSRLQAQFGTAPGDELMADPTQLALEQLPHQLLSLLTATSFMGDPTRIQMGSRGAWTQQEDEHLRAAVASLGPKKWADISKFVPTRTSKQCRERWFNHLAPNLKREPFEPWEDGILMEKQRELGNKWAHIASFLPGRSPGAVKNRWYSGLKNQAIAFDPIRLAHDDSTLLLLQPDQPTTDL